MEQANSVKKKQMRSFEECRDLVNEWRSSGLSQSAWCRLKGISWSVLSRWRQKINGVDTAGSVGISPGAFIPVHIGELPSVGSPTISSALHIDILLKSGHKVQVQGLGEQQVINLVQHLVG